MSIYDWVTDPRTLKSFNDQTRVDDNEGTIQMFKYGVLHCETGPAVYYMDGREEYCWYGKCTFKYDVWVKWVQDDSW